MKIQALLLSWPLAGAAGAAVARLRHTAGLAASQDPVLGGPGQIAVQGLLHDEEQLIDRLMLSLAASRGEPASGGMDVVGDMINKTLLPDILNASQAAQLELDGLISAFQECAAPSFTQEGELKTAAAARASNKALHETCRNEESVDFDAHSDCERTLATLQQAQTMACNAVGAVSDSAGEVEQLCERPAGLGFGAYLDNIFEQVQRKREEFQQAKESCDSATAAATAQAGECRGKKAAFESKRQSCDTLQASVEDAYCSVDELLGDSCTSYGSCYESKKSAHDSRVPLIKAEEANRKVNYRVLKRIQCLVPILKGGDAKAIEACRSKVHDTSILDLRYEEPPEAQQCPAAGPTPCGQDYLQIYASLPASARAAACNPCPGFKPKVWRFTDHGGTGTAVSCGAQPNTIECASTDGTNCLWGHFPGKKYGDVVSEEEVRGKAGGNLVPAVASCPGWAPLDGSDSCAKFDCYNEQTTKGAPLGSNFDFEADDVGASYRYTVPQGWKGNGNIVIVPNGNGPWGGLSSGEGQFFISVQTRGSYLEQTLTQLVPKTRYTVSFLASNRPNYGQAKLVVTVDGAAVLPSKALPVGFARYTVDFVASGTTATIRFLNDSPGGDHSVFVDGIVVEAQAAMTASETGATEVRFEYMVVAGSSVVLQPTEDIEAAKAKLNTYPPGASSPSRMICAFKNGILDEDPHTIGPDNADQGGGYAAGFNKWWQDWHDIHRMNAVCASSYVAPTTTSTTKALQLVYVDAPGTTSWSQAVEFAKSQGGRLPTKAEVAADLQAKGNKPLFDFDVWTPVSDLVNEWVSVGNYDPVKRLGKGHIELFGPPGWGQTSAYGKYRTKMAIMKPER